jgi:secreted Zn-dependent insulinase-like peptidase
MDIQKKIETERFVRELLAELDKMSREELEDFRPKVLQEMRRTGRLNRCEIATERRTPWNR